MVTIAHLSDPHLGPLPTLRLRRLLNKRLLGFANWRRNRRFFHVRAVADLMAEDIKRVAPDHVVVTGDLVNLSLEEEFEAAASWLQALGSHDWVSVVPGNHDAYVPVSWEQGIGRWQGHMTADALGRAYAQGDARFPYVRVIGDVAIVGLSSAVPMPLHSAGGRLGAAQLVALEAVLEALGRDGLYRMVLIHHPPLPGQNVARKALVEAAALQAVLTAQGAELVLHGHNHTDMLETIETSHGLAHILGVPSASAEHHGLHPAAQYNLYTVTGGSGSPVCEVTVRGYDPDTRTFGTVNAFELAHGVQPDSGADR